MPIFVADEVVTAAKMNKIYKPVAAAQTTSRTFTNTTYLDLDALTGGSGTVAATIVTATTETTALVMLNCLLANTGGVTLMGFRISGATTRAVDELLTARNPGTGQLACSFQVLVTGLTAGSNVFELQARGTAGTGTISQPSLIVIPI